MRRLPTAALLLALAACQTPSPLPPEELPGRYFSGKPGASLCLQLSADGSYQVDGSGLLGRRIEGQWSLESDRLRLRRSDRTEPDRLLLLRIESDRIYLVDAPLVESFDDGSIDQDSDQLIFHRRRPDQD